MLIPPIFGGADYRFDVDRAECRTQDAEATGPQILGAAGGTLSGPLAGRGSDPGQHQKTRNWPIGNLEQFELKI